MPVIAMNVPCSIERLDGFDLYGRPVALSLPVQTVCAVLTFSTARAKTAIKTDASASRSHADERVLDVKVLMSKKTQIDVGDILSLRGSRSRVLSVRQRFDVMGRLDHLEVEATIE